VTAAAGAVQRPQPTLADLRRLVEESRHAGAEVLLDERVADASGLPVGMGRTAYRIVQEGLTNARKHAGDQPVRVEVRGRPGERLVVDVLNALPGGTGGTGGAGGAGASDARPEAGGTPGMPGSGTGLIGLAERVLLSDGDMAAGLTAAGEFRLSASLPWPR
jgi:signal transduction histidine kinase